MMTIHPSSLRGLFGDAATGGPSPGSSNDPAGFASLLRQTHAMPTPMPMPTKAPAPIPASPPKSPAHESATGDEAPNDSETLQKSTDAASRARALLKGKLRAADEAKPVALGTQPTPDTTKADATAEARIAATDTSDAAQKNAANASATTAAIDPSVMHWLAGLQRAASESASESAADGEATAVSGDSTDAATGSPGAAKGLRAADLKADADLKDKAAQGKAQRIEAAGGREFAGVLAEQRIGEKLVAAPISAVARLTDAAAASALPPTPALGNEGPAPTAVVIATPVNAPDFAQALGLRLSVLAKDGVQTAELHLNPADMGPVSVQIVMDGTQARIDFGADMAATRHAIEAGLPELASALRDAGFTLAGGGVSQHGGGHGGRDESRSSDGGRQRNIATDDDTKQVASAARRIVTRGGIDLIA